VKEDDFDIEFILGQAMEIPEELDRENVELNRSMQCRFL